ncbi:MAG: D-alanine--D-alanine ligase [Candidatus Eremiobacter antarcticus]|nr:D-alanine--D-alanine ligase [Candidatus Eremiobacteraeota bacterium]MBC5808356.1 D-alanine--D-alanine ligase [Candidatus Eremiobacteraeota bacterium]PZR63724.1 MAG: D-alanine--D-alanine ligase [Candidatus Eremiobacter sp. RRmetagenome_bin22]
MTLDIVVLMGGSSPEREISLQTGAGVMQALKALHHRATALDFDDRVVAEIRRLRPAAVFNALHGGAGENGTAAALLDWMGVAYQGSGVRASAIAMDKWLSKAAFRAEGIPVPPGRRLPARALSASASAPDVALPCVVKPIAEGSAVGVSIVRSSSDLPAAAQAAAPDGGDVLIEDYIAGREFTVAVLGEEALPVVEITPHEQFYSYRAKYTAGGSTHTVPADLEPAAAEEMQRLGLAVHRALGCRDYSRTDLLMDDGGRVAVLECNTLPGLTPLSLFPDAARAAGIAYEALVERLLGFALARS